MSFPSSTYGIWDYSPKRSEYFARRNTHNTISLQDSQTVNNGNPFYTRWIKTRLSNATISSGEKEEWSKNGRLSGRFRFSKSFGTSKTSLLPVTRPAFRSYDQEEEDQSVSCGKQFLEYCSSTSLHGYRYISQSSRAIFERILWLGLCITGIIFASYMMSKIWSKWSNNPVQTSVATTNHPVTNVLFPAVTICTVDKAMTEKLIIQSCRYNYTLSQMKTIVSTLVDPDARNNDRPTSYVVNVRPETILKYLRLVAPKCDDYLLTCKWNSLSVPCDQIFRIILTDSGYCCTFNSLETNDNRENEIQDEEIRSQEAEFEYLQKAIWEYTDMFYRKNGEKLQENENHTFKCNREYSDDLFPGICQHLQNCRENLECKLKFNPKLHHETSDSLEKLQKEFPLKVAGAGRTRGLTVMVDTLKCESIPIDSFRGFRIYVHTAEEFPAVNERGYIIGPGMETQVSVNAIETYSAQSLHRMSPDIRGCYFPQEFPLKFYNEYSRSTCVVECETEFIYRECQCTRHFSPGNYSLCTLKQYNDCVKGAVDLIQKKTLPETILHKQGSSIFKFISKKELPREKSCSDFCLPACNRTSYNVLVTGAKFPNQKQVRQTKIIREAIEMGYTHLNDMDYVSESISIVSIFFRESAIMQYVRDELFTWEDFVSNAGGVLSLCSGFSLLSFLELVYFFTLRMVIDKRRQLTQQQLSNSDENRAGIVELNKA